MFRVTPGPGSADAVSGTLGQGRKPRTEVQKKHSTKKQGGKHLDSSELDQLFTRLQVASTRLNAAAQDAGRRIEALEERLAQAEPGMSVWGATLLTEPTTFQSGDARPPEAAERVLTLGYARVKKDKWGIAVRELVRSANGAVLAEETILLSKAERALRLLALPQLEGLTRQIVETVEAQLAKLQEDQDDESEQNAEQPSRSLGESAHN